MSFITSRKTALLILLVATLVISACERESVNQTSTKAASQVADIALINGGIYTVDEKRNWVKAAAILDGVFIAVGSNSEIDALPCWVVHFRQRRVSMTSSLK